MQPATKPVIAITPEAQSLSRAGGDGSFCGLSYSDAIVAAGGVPVLIPLTTDKCVLDHFLQNSQGLMLTGGGDVSAQFYDGKLTNQERATIKGVNDTRDEMEMHLVRQAVRADVPVLGICRGIQVMNIALGGTLIPDISLRKPGALQHQNPKLGARAHSIEWVTGSQMERALGGDYDSVNTTHHQAVDRPADGFDVVARAPDGIIEAMELRGARFVCGVQFHPERMFREAPEFLRLFEAIVKAAAKRPF